MSATPNQLGKRPEQAGIESLRQIGQGIEHLESLSPTDISERDFYRLLLDHAVQAGAAIGGVVWSVDEASRFRILVTHPLCNFDQISASANDDRYHAMLKEVGNQSEATWIKTPTSEVRAWWSLTEGCLFSCAIRFGQRGVRVVEILQRSELDPDTCRGYASILEAVCEVAVGFHQKLIMQQHQTRTALAMRTEDFTARIHDALDTETVACRIANEGRRLSGCDRLTVLVHRHDRYRVRAVSGLDRPETRANTVQRLQMIVEQVAPTGEPLWYDGANEDLPPQLQSAIADLLDLTHSRTLVIMPLNRDSRSTEPKQQRIGALVFEMFDARPVDGEYRQRVSIVARHSRVALENAERYSRLPLVGCVEVVGAWLRLGRLRWAAVVTACLVIAVAVLCLVPANLDVVCQGVAQPAERRQVFAPTDGQVVEIAAQHGDRVAADQTLVILNSPELALEYTRVLGELQTVEKQLASIRSTRLGGSSTTTTQREESVQLAADEQRLQAVLRSLAEQRELLDQQRQRLRITSPIDGQILTWQVTERLQSRPVQRGQLLMTIGDTRGAWVLELRVPDKDIQIVQAAEATSNDGLLVTFLLASDPASRYTARMGDLSLLIEPDAEGRLSALAIGSIDAANLPELRPGTSVTARIHCGRRAMGYVWLRDLLASLRRWLFI